MSVYLTVRAVADRLGVSERSVRRWCRTGHIPARTGCWQPAGYRGGWLVARAWLDAAPTTVAEMSAKAVTSDGDGNTRG